MDEWMSEKFSAYNSKGMILEVGEGTEFITGKYYHFLPHLKKLLEDFMEIYNVILLNPPSFTFL